MNATPKLLVIGLDGASWDLIRPWAESGELPLFRSFLAEGACGVLDSGACSAAPAGWTTAFTGVNPGQHGIFEAVALDPGSESVRVLTSADRLRPALWQIVEENALRAGVLNVPLTYPAERITFMVSGMGTPGFHGDWAAPPSAREMIRTDFPDFHFGAPTWALEQGDYGGFLETLGQLGGAREQVALRLAREHDPNLLAFVCDGLGWVQHFYWHFFDPSHPLHREPPEPHAEIILRAHRGVEAIIRGLRDAMGGTPDLCVFSDHGCGPLHTDVFLNDALAGWGLFRPLPVTAEVQAKPLWKRAAKKVVSPEARHWLRTHLKASPLGCPLGFIDWTRTKAFCAGISGRALYVNLRGRQPHGTVEPGAQYEALRAELVERLEALKDPATGKPVVEKVYRREDIFRGSRLEAAPDLLVEAAPGYAMRADWGVGPFAPSSLQGIPRTGSHRRGGLLALHGPSFRPGDIRGARLEDIAPTLCACMGLPVGDRMEGRVLLEAFRQPPPDQRASYEHLDPGIRVGLSVREQAMLAERLSGLGYME